MSASKGRWKKSAVLLLLSLALSAVVAGCGRTWNHNGETDQQARSDPQESGGREPQESGGREPQESSGREPQESSGREPQENSGREPQESGGGDTQESGGRDTQAPDRGMDGKRQSQEWEETGGREMSGKKGIEKDGGPDEMKTYRWDRLENKTVKLPSAYDYRKAGRAPQIGNQGSLGTCWAFASLTALESSILPGDSMTFAVDHMSMHNSFLLGQDEGGEYTMSMAYLLAWQGPVAEEEDPYGDGVSPDGLSPRVHVQEIQVLPAKDYEAIKRAVYLRGGVQSSLYTSMRDYESQSVYYNRDTNSYCYIGNEKPNHDSVIVGWDDNYSRDHFNMELAGDGAFICTNSWGEDFGDQGYFYVSYYDTNIGVHNIVYTGVEPVDNYDHIYQSDLCGWVGQIGYGQDEAWFANAYRAGKGEYLSAAGFYATDKDTEYELYLARSLPENHKEGMEEALSSPVLLAEGRLDHAGYYTVPLKEKILLDDNEKFAIIVKIITPGTVHPVAIEYDAEDGIAQVELGDGEGYLSHDGKVWEHVEETQNCNLCLKAYTTDRP